MRRIQGKADIFYDIEKKSTKMGKKGKQTGKERRINLSLY